MTGTDAAHLAEVEAWREHRYAALRRPMSWLSLVGLDWLDEGTATAGADPACQIRLAHGPPLAGRLERSGRSVRAFGARDGLAIAGAPLPATGVALVSDTDAGPAEPTILELGPLRMVLICRGDRFALRTWDTSSPRLASFAGIPHYPVDRRWRVAARYLPHAEPQTIAVPDVLGGTNDLVSPGRVALDLGGTPALLEAVRSGDDGSLWLIFADATNGAGTYEAGRFLYTDAPRADGTVVVDFNRAYNPPCVFSPYATCPLPPPGNRLPHAIEAGERSFAAVG